MIVVRVCLTSKEENISALSAVLANDVTNTNAFDGCVRYDVYQGINDECEFILYEEWENQQSFDAYKASDYFKDIGGKIFPLLDGTPDSAYYQAELIPQ